MQKPPSGQTGRSSMEASPDTAAIQALLQRAGIAATEAEVRTVAKMLARLAPPAETPA